MNTQGDNTALILGALVRQDTYSKAEGIKYSWGFAQIGESTEGRNF
jgi:hypothetical protein